MVIDKNKKYILDDYVFKNFIELSDSEKKQVWQWRNDVRISQWMCNKNVISFQEHIAFIERLKERDDAFYWLVYKRDNLIGVFDLINIDWRNCEAEPGYYLNPEFLNSGEGLFLNYYYRFFIFKILGVAKINGHIQKNNKIAYLLSTFFGVKPIDVVRGMNFDYIVMRGDKSNFKEFSSMRILLSDFKLYVKGFNQGKEFASF